jgi:hypothetical protein
LPICASGNAHRNSSGLTRIKRRQKAADEELVNRLAIAFALAAQDATSRLLPEGARPRSVLALRLL